MLAHVIDDSEGEIRHGGEDNLLALHLRSEAPLLLLHGAQEEEEPRLPVGLRRADRALGLAQREVIGLLAVLDDALQRAVGHIRITGLEQEDCRQDATEAAVAVLERVDFEEHDDEHADDEKRMQAATVAGLL